MTLLFLFLQYGIRAHSRCLNLSRSLDHLFVIFFLSGILQSFIRLDFFFPFLFHFDFRIFISILESVLLDSTMESEISSQSNRSAIDDPLSLFFLHYSDSLGLVLVSQQLTGDNYPSWTRAMIIALMSVKNKLGFIDGSITTKLALKLKNTS